MRHNRVQIRASVIYVYGGTCAITVVHATHSSTIVRKLDAKLK